MELFQLHFHFNLKQAQKVISGNEVAKKSTESNLKAFLTLKILFMRAFSP